MGMINTQSKTVVPLGMNHRVGIRVLAVGWGLGVYCMTHCTVMQESMIYLNLRLTSDSYLCNAQLHTHRK